MSDMGDDFNALKKARQVAEAAPVASAEPVAYLYGGDFYLPDEYALTPAMKANAVALYEHPVAQATPAPTAEPVAKGEPREIRNAAGELVGIARRSCAPGLASPSPHPVSIGAEADKLRADIEAIADELEADAANYEGDFADTVNGCAEALRQIVAAHPSPEGGAAEASDPVVEANRQLLLERSRVGIKKYQTTLAGAGLTPAQFARHALEEALDLANYLQALIQTEAATPPTQQETEK